MIGLSNKLYFPFGPDINYPLQYVYRNGIIPTVWMKILTMFSVYMHLPHHYKINLAHPSDFYRISLECGNLKDEQNKIKNEGLDAYLKNLHTIEIIWRISQVFYWSKSTSYWTIFKTFKYIFQFFDNLVRALFWLFGRNMSL